MARAVPVGVLIAFACSLTGCATVYWTKSGFNQADWDRDRYECERDMRQSGYYGNDLAAVLSGNTPEGFFERCLQAKGYYKTQATYQTEMPSRATPGSSENRVCANADRSETIDR